MYTLTNKKRNEGGMQHKKLLNKFTLLKKTKDLITGQRAVIPKTAKGIKNVRSVLTHLKNHMLYSAGMSFAKNVLLLA
jgi:hypothetical protein